ncbi:hypothetical protein [Haloferula rosea]|uniref:Uncharacterized protein n=1 Tax=Haloferula rosea TaxID=490093 RepID=A0A934VF57_9BACT|nr:hypothetical protein [Haloferula rosea]MBK1826726.1 hypothetical protein [Haloferula rosea]
MNEEPGFEAGDAGRGTHPILKLLFVFIAVLGIWGLIAGWLLIRRPEPPPAAVERQSWQEAPADEQALTQAMEAWRAFVEAPDLETRIEHVRDPERVGPMMRDYYDSRAHSLPTMGRALPGRAVRQGAQNMILIEVEDYQGRRYAVAMVWTGRRYAVDWESLSAYGTMDWPRLVEEKPAEPQVLRVYLAALPESLTPPESIVGPRRFVRMEHRDFSESLPLALRPELTREVTQLVEGRRVPVTVEVRWNADLGQFELQRLLGLSWSTQY